MASRPLESLLGHVPGAARRSGMRQARLGPCPQGPSEGQHHGLTGPRCAHSVPYQTDSAFLLEPGWSVPTAGFGTSTPCWAACSSLPLGSSSCTAVALRYLRGGLSGSRVPASSQKAAMTLSSPAQTSGALWKQSREVRLGPSARPFSVLLSTAAGDSRTPLNRLFGTFSLVLCHFVPLLLPMLS